MIIAEFHRFAAPFIMDGFSHFVWTVYEKPDGSNIPAFADAYGFALDVSAADPVPVTYQRYNPDTGTFAAALAEDAVADLLPFHDSIFDNESQNWIPREKPPEEEDPPE